MPNDRREIIEKAWDDAEKAAPEEKEPIEAVATEIVDLPEELPLEKDPQKEAPVEADKKSDDAYSQEKKAATAREQPAAPVTDKPPVSWKPTQREQWNKLPADVRGEITRREKQIQETLTQTDQVRKFANEFAQVVQPYAEIIRSQNSTPLRAVASLMQTAAGLTNGSPEQRAQVVANIIGQYGIDVATLDKVLSGVVRDGRIPSQQPQVEQPPPWARPILSFMDTVQSRQQQAVEQSRQQAAQEIELLSERPFFEDLREDMADIIELADKRGIKLSLEQAYNKAVAQNDEISGIINQRKAAATARSPVSEAAATLARARRAASSVSGGPSSGEAGKNTTARTRRQIIEDAWEDAAR